MLSLDGVYYTLHKDHRGLFLFDVDDSMLQRGLENNQLLAFQSGQVLMTLPAQAEVFCAQVKNLRILCDERASSPAQLLLVCAWLAQFKKREWQEVDVFPSSVAHADGLTRTMSLQLVSSGYSLPGQLEIRLPTDNERWQLTPAHTPFVALEVVRRLART